MNSSKVVITKDYLKKVFVKEEDLAKTLSRFINNSIKAREKINNSKNPCIVEIIIFDTLITIKDNSGGIISSISDTDLFKIGIKNGDLIEGIGMKQSFFILGDKIDIISNNKDLSRKFTIDLNLNDEELISKSEIINYDDSIPEGTTIFISNLNKNIAKDINNNYCIDNLIERLGRIYCKFIEKNCLKIYVNNKIVSKKDIEGKIISSTIIREKYSVVLYKNDKGVGAGIDLFINDYMYYDRMKGPEVNWNSLNKVKHRYSGCIIEITYKGDKLEFLAEKNVLFKEIVKFIEENESFFRSSTIIIQFEADISKVDELKSYYDENTAKAIGIKAFDKLYQMYIESKDNFD